MRLLSDVTDLETQDRAGLVALWRQLFSRPAPSMLSQPFLRRFIAFELQSRPHGGLSRQIKASLKKGSEQKPRSTCPALKPGGRLLRE